jgi:hypothetical protein
MTTRGVALADAIDDNDYCVLNTHSPTRLTANSNPSSSDVSIISAHLLMTSSWTTDVRLNSDHLPITINIDNDTPPSCSSRTFTNFRLADWAGFVAACESKFGTAPLLTSCDQGERIFRKILVDASNRFIPSGHVKNFTPGLPREALPLMKSRDALRSADPDDPEIARLNTEISNMINETSRKEWIEKVEKTNPNSTNFWSLLRNLSGKKVFQPQNQPTTFKDKVFTKASAIANHFTSQFTSVAPHKSNPLTRRVMRKLHRTHKPDRSFSPFMTKLTEAAIMASKNLSAMGPDGLSALHLKHLGSEL